MIFGDCPVYVTFDRPCRFRCARILSCPNGFCRKANRFRSGFFCFSVRTERTKLFCCSGRVNCPSVFTNGEKARFYGFFGDVCGCRRQPFVGYRKGVGCDEPNTSFPVVCSLTVSPRKGLRPRRTRAAASFLYVSSAVLDIVYVPFVRIVVRSFYLPVHFAPVDACYEISLTVLAVARRRDVDRSRLARLHRNTIQTPLFRGFTPSFSDYTQKLYLFITIMTYIIFNRTY